MDHVQKKKKKKNSSLVTLKKEIQRRIVWRCFKNRENEKTKKNTSSLREKRVNNKKTQLFFFENEILTVFVKMFDRKKRSNFQKNPEKVEHFYGRTLVRSNISALMFYCKKRSNFLKNLEKVEH